MKTGIRTAALGWALLGMGCSRSNNVFLGRVEANLGGHSVVVTDCYRTTVPPAEQFLDGATVSYRFKPCRDADVLVRGDELTVNGRSYGRLRSTDAIMVDHGVVSIEKP